MANQNQNDRNNKNQQGYRLKLLFTPNDKFEAEM